MLNEAPAAWSYLFYLHKRGKDCYYCITMQKGEKEPPLEKGQKIIFYLGLIYWCPVPSFLISNYSKWICDADSDTVFSFCLEWCEQLIET